MAILEEINFYSLFSREFLINKYNYPFSLDTVLRLLIVPKPHLEMDLSLITCYHVKGRLQSVPNSYCPFNFCVYI